MPDSSTSPEDERSQFQPQVPMRPATSAPQNVDRNEDDDETDSSSSDDQAPSPKPQPQHQPPPPQLLRSHTPGQLASKYSSSSRQQRKNSSDAAQRQRAVSAAHVPVRPATSGGHRSATSSTKAASNAAAAAAAADQDDEANRADHDSVTSKRPIPLRSTSAITAPPSTSSSSPATRRQQNHNHSTSSIRSLTAVNGAAKPQSTPHPPLQDPKDAPDVPPAPASGMYWSRAPLSGVPRPPIRAHATTLIGSNIYVFGGCDSRTCFNDLYVLDADSWHWSKPQVFGDVPCPLRAMTCTAVGKRLVVFGGGDGPAYYNDVHVLDTVNFRWSRPKIIGDKVPSKRRAHTACLYKNGIYVFGGGDGIRALNDIWRLDVGDMTKMSWRLVSPGGETTPAGDPKPRPRGYHTTNVVGGKLIIYGGSDGGKCFSDVWLYDIDAQVWRAMPPSPTASQRLSHTATLVGSYLFVIGGHDGEEYSDQVLLLNLVTLTWDRRKIYGAPPQGRGYHGAVLYDSRLVVVGGYGGSEVFGDVMVLELAVHAYYSQISHYTIEL